MEILLVEDDKNIREMVYDFLIVSSWDDNDLLLYQQKLLLLEF